MGGKPSKAISLQRKCEMWQFGDLVTTGVAVFRYRARPDEWARVWES